MNEDSVKLARQAVWKLVITSLMQTITSKAENEDDAIETIQKCLEFISSTLTEEAIDDFKASYDCLVVMAEIHNAASARFNKP